VPLVSVVLPSRNRWPFLRQALASALAQEGVDLEVVVVDDGSTDETPARLAEVADTRLRVLRHDVASGVARARNDGIEAARGEYVAFLDDDDLWAPAKTREQLAALEAAGAGLAWSGTVVVDETGRALRRLRVPPAGDVRERLRGGNVIGSPSVVLARRELVRRIGGFDERLAVLADWDLWLGLTRLASGAACPEVHLAYTEHGANMHATAVRAVRRELRLLAAKHADAGLRLGDEWLLRWLAASHRRAGEHWRAAGLYAQGFARHRAGRDLRAAAGAVLRDRVRPAPPDFPDEPGLTTPPWVRSFRG
jgi:glycosyltransferase involved in cell wall biosynthesis